MKDLTTLKDKKIAVGNTVLAMKKITELPKNDNWKNDPKHVRSVMMAIIKICAENGMIPTINLMAMGLGVSKQTEYNVRTGVTAAASEVVDILNEFCSICENVTLQATLDGTANNIGGIFVAKALYNYRDEPKEIVVTHNFNGLLGERKDADAIAERYAEAVVIDVEPSEMRYLKEESDGNESE